MCNLPGCPNGDSEPIELTDENRSAMRVEATSAAIQMLNHYVRGWSQGADGILADISDKWGFVGVTRVMYVLAQAIVILPMPEDSPLKPATPESIKERLRMVAGEEAADHAAVQMIAFGEQVTAAFRETVALARRGHEHEDAFTTRFDQITDAENITGPLIKSIMLYATVSFAAAQRDDNTFALDQFQSACRAGIDLGQHDEEAALELAELTALFHLDDADGH